MNEHINMFKFFNLKNDTQIHESHQIPFSCLTSVSGYWRVTLSPNLHREIMSVYIFCPLSHKKEHHYRPTPWASNRKNPFLSCLNFINSFCPQSTKQMLDFPEVSLIRVSSWMRVSTPMIWLSSDNHTAQWALMMALTFLPGSGSLYPIPYHISSVFPFQNHLNSMCLKLNWSLLPAKSLPFWYYLLLRMSPLMVKIRSVASGLLVPIHTHAVTTLYVSILPPKSSIIPFSPSPAHHHLPPQTCSLLWLLALPSLHITFSGELLKRESYHCTAQNLSVATHCPYRKSELLYVSCKVCCDISWHLLHRFSLLVLPTACSKHTKGFSFPGNLPVPDTWGSSLPSCCPEGCLRNIFIVFISPPQPPNEIHPFCVSFIFICSEEGS